MLNIKVTTNLERATDELSGWLAAFGTDEVQDMAAVVLKEAHRRAFDEGGRLAPGDWEPTDPWWTERMEGKAGKGPLVWSGEARDSIEAENVGDAVEVRAVGYLAKFEVEAGTGESFTEEFSIRKTGPGKSDFIKLKGEGGQKIKRRITPRKRAIFAFTEEDADEILARCMREAGLL